jgi:putative membrane protein
MIPARLRTFACILLATALLCTAAVPASAEQPAAVSGAEETVYGNIHPDGTYSINTVYKLKVDSKGEYTIHGRFLSAKNLTADIDFDLTEDGVTLRFPRNFSEFFFQVESGRISKNAKDSNVELPFFIEYHIETEDGTRLVPKGGESGRIKLVVRVTANEDADDYFRSRYMAQIQIPIRADVFRNIETDLSGVLTGKTYTFSAVVLPGTSDTFTIEGDVESLELDSISVIMLDYDLSSMADTSILSGIDELKNGAAELADGTRRLGEGMEDLSEGLNELNRAVKSVRDGAGRFADSMSAYEEGFTELTGGSDSLVEGTAGIATGLSELSAQGAALVEGFSQIKQVLMSMLSGTDNTAMITELSEGLRSIAGAIQNSPTMSTAEKQQILAGLNGIIEGLPQAGGETDQLSGLASRLDAYEQGLRDFVGGVSMLSAGASELSEGTGRYVSGVVALRDNFIKLSLGAEELKQGLIALGIGHNDMTGQVAGLPDEVKKLADGQQAMYDGINQFVSVISEYTGGEDEPAVISSLSSGNRVDKVQFVFRTDAVKPEKPEKEAVTTEQEKNFFDRLLDLFR